MKKKYDISCPDCGATYTLGFPASYCAECGSGRIMVSVVKGKARVTAERKMVELDEIRPLLELVRSEYFKVRVEYEDALQFLAQYYRRGIVTREEYMRYKLSELDMKKGLNEELGKYRAAKGGKAV